MLQSKVPLPFDALVSFAFNLGAGALQRSTLRRKVNREEHAAVPAEFRRWIWAGGRRLKGLVRRREAEAVLYAGKSARAEAGNRLKSGNVASEGAAPPGRNPPRPTSCRMRSITPCSAASSLAGSRRAPSKLRSNAGAISKRIPIR